MALRLARAYIAGTATATISPTQQKVECLSMRCMSMNKHWFEQYARYLIQQAIILWKMSGYVKTAEDIAAQAALAFANAQDSPFVFTTNTLIQAEDELLAFELPPLPAHSKLERR